MPGEEKIDFEKESQKSKDEDDIAIEELDAEDFEGSQFVKYPVVGEELVLKITKVVRNKNTKGKNKETGKEFDIGVKDKNGIVKRYDLYTDKGIFTVKNWELYFKLFDNQKGLLILYANKNKGKFAGATMKLKKLLDGGHANVKPEDLAKIIGKSVDEANKYKEEIKKAIKESRLYQVSVE